MSTDLSAKKILVVDHSKVITKIIQNFLSKSGFEAGNIFCQGQSKFVPVWRSKSVPLGLKNIGY
jgi:hypothetical protein